MSSFPVFKPLSGDPPKAGGFTLVELLVALMASTILIVLLANVGSQALQISKHTGESMRAVNSAAAAVDLIASDLDCLSVTKQPFEYLQAADESPPINGTNPMRLMLNISSPQDTGIPLVSGSTTTYPGSAQTLAVCYRLFYQDPLNTASGTKPVMGLYRTTATDPSASNPPATAGAYAFANFLGQTNIGTPWTNYWNGKTPTSGDFVVANIVDLQIAFYAGVSDTTSLNPPGAPNQPYQAFRLAGNGYTVGGSGAMTAGQPTVAEITITVLEDAGAILWGSGTGTGALSPVSLRQKYGHTLTRRVLLRSPY